MKKRLGIVLAVVMLLTLLPAAAMAAKPADLEITVRNQTGGVVELSLKNDAGTIYKTLPVGGSILELTEGRYTYFASTICGNKSGPFNAVKGKEFYLTCENGPVVLYEVCQFVGYDPNSDQIYDPWLEFQADRAHGYYHGYRQWLFEAWALGNQSFSCEFGLQAKDYWDGVKPPDTKPDYGAPK